MSIDIVKEKQEYMEKWSNSFIDNMLDDPRVKTLFANAETPHEKKRINKQLSDIIKEYIDRRQKEIDEL